MKKDAKGYVHALRGEKNNVYLSTILVKAAVLWRFIATDVAFLSSLGSSLLRSVSHASAADTSRTININISASASATAIHSVRTTDIIYIAYNRSADTQIVAVEPAQ